MSRLENLLGAQALALSDRFLGGAGHSADEPVSPSDCAALVTLLSYPDQNVGWLGGVLGLTSSGVTRLVERLVKRGWIQRSAGDDARSRQVRLTTAGEAQAHRTLDARRSALSHTVAALTGRERRDLERLLDKVVTSLAADRPAALRVCRLCDRDACGSGRGLCPLEHTVG